MPVENAIVAFGEQVEILSSLNVGSVWERLRGEFLNEWSRLQRQGLSEADIADELEGFLDRLSSKPVQDRARKSASVAYNQGRSAEIKSQPVVEYVVRSEILDQNTCAECSALDGAVVEVNSKDFDRLMPPAYCLGGDRCRGFYIAVQGA